LCSQVQILLVERILKAAIVAMKVPERHLQLFKPFPKAATNIVFLSTSKTVYFSGFRGTRS
jgi:hypothetical protein